MSPCYSKQQCVCVQVYKFVMETMGRAQNDRQQYLAIPKILGGKITPGCNVENSSGLIHQVTPSIISLLLLLLLLLLSSSFIHHHKLYSDSITTDAAKQYLRNLKSAQFHLNNQSLSTLSTITFKFQHLIVLRTELEFRFW
jgi:hypothetical protein